MAREHLVPSSLDSELWRDVPARQRQIGQVLRRWYQTVTVQDVPQQMLDLLRQAERQGCAFVSAPASHRDPSSVATAMTIVAALVATLLVVDVAWLAITRPAVAATVAFIAAFATIAVGSVWLIEDR